MVVCCIKWPRRNGTLNSNIECIKNYVYWLIGRRKPYLFFFNFFPNFTAFLLPGPECAVYLKELPIDLQVWSARTPSSFKSKYFNTIFSEVNPDSETEVKSRLCLPVSSEVTFQSFVTKNQFKGHDSSTPDNALLILICDG